MKPWILYSILAWLLWSMWPIFQKSSVKWLDPMWTYLLSSLGSFLTATLIFFFIPFPSEIPYRGVLFALLSGICGTLGALFFTLAVAQGKASIIVPFTAMYPAMSIVLGLLLFKETISLTQGIGIILALVSVFLLSL